MVSDAIKEVLMIKGKAVIFAPNSHAGGGLVVLESILEQLPAELEVHAFLDSRARDDLAWFSMISEVEWVDPTIISRLRAEWLLSEICMQDDIVLCLHSLPPICHVRGVVKVFQQNRNLVDDISVRDFKPWQAIRLLIERQIAYFGRKKVSEYIVQTESFRREIERWYGYEEDVTGPFVKVLPFVARQYIIPSSTSTSVVPSNEFIYVADGLAHKNHRNLLKAWEILASQQLFPQLTLTIPDKEEALIKAISELQAIGVRIINIGWTSRESVLQRLRGSDALIYPSLRESFGLPLWEASQLGVPILAGELDFVYDVCNPDETFNPDSPFSIARAVSRFLKIAPPLLEVREPLDFINHVFKNGVCDESPSESK